MSENVFLLFLHMTCCLGKLLGSPYYCVLKFHGLLCLGQLYLALGGSFESRGSSSELSNVHFNYFFPVVSLSLCLLLFPLYETPIRWPFPFEPPPVNITKSYFWPDQCHHIKSPPGSCLGSVSPSVRVLKAEVERGWVKLGVGKTG